MSPALSYGPAYLGLYATLLLALACNAFLDIGYGSFGIEMLLWALVQGWTLRIGWKQAGHSDEAARRIQWRVAIAGLLLTAVVFLPMYGLPRAGVYMLGLLQAALNCVTTTRRHLHIGLLVSAVLVMFATSHYRADWTMLFYLVPYVAAAVFTLVAEQISRRAAQLRQASLGSTSGAGQGLAIAAATATILLTAAALYAITPQIFLPQILWRYGEPGVMGRPGGALDGGGSGAGQGGRPADSQGGSSSAGPPEPPPGGGWPSVAQMREAARRPGMPRWQSDAIGGAADLSEAIERTSAPLRRSLRSWWDDLMRWLERHGSAAQLALLAALLTAALLALLVLLREARALTWLRTRLDYARLGIFAAHARGTRGAAQYLRAIERLFELVERPRSPQHNLREYLRELAPFDLRARPEMLGVVDIFERCRYGPQPASELQLCELRALYRAVFRKF